jgi:hypothetical protein
MYRDDVVGSDLLILLVKAGADMDQKMKVLEKLASIIDIAIVIIDRELYDNITARKQWIADELRNHDCAIMKYSMDDYVGYYALGKDDLDAHALYKWWLNATKVYIM